MLKKNKYKLQMEPVFTVNVPIDNTKYTYYYRDPERNTTNYVLRNGINKIELPSGRSTKLFYSLKNTNPITLTDLSVVTSPAIVDIAIGTDDLPKILINSNSNSSIGSSNLGSSSSNLMSSSSNLGSSSSNMGSSSSNMGSSKSGIVRVLIPVDGNTYYYIIDNGLSNFGAINKVQLSQGKNDITLTSGKSLSLYYSSSPSSSNLTPLGSTYYPGDLVNVVLGRAGKPKVVSSGGYSKSKIYTSETLDALTKTNVSLPRTDTISDITNMVNELTEKYKSSLNLGSSTSSTSSTSSDKKSSTSSTSSDKKSSTSSTSSDKVIIKKPVSPKHPLTMTLIYLTLLIVLIGVYIKIGENLSSIQLKGLIAGIVAVGLLLLFSISIRTLSLSVVVYIPLLFLYLVKIKQMDVSKQQQIIMGGTMSVFIVLFFVTN